MSSLDSSPSSSILAYKLEEGRPGREEEVRSRREADPLYYISNDLEVVPPRGPRQVRARGGDLSRSNSSLAQQQREVPDMP